MMRFQRYPYVIFASIWAMLPWSGPVWFIGLAMGVWALRVLRRPEVKMAFIRNTVHARLSVRAPAPPTAPYRGRIHSLFGAVGSLFFASRVNAREPMTEANLPRAALESSGLAADQALAEAKQALSQEVSPAPQPPVRVTVHPGIWMAVFLLFAILLAGGLLFSRVWVQDEGGPAQVIERRAP
jgi:hypothetical protein